MSFNLGYVRQWWVNTAVYRWYYRLWSRWKFQCRICGGRDDVFVAPATWWRPAICIKCCDHPDYEHERGHGWVCVECGDDAPYDYGVYDE